MNQWLKDDDNGNARAQARWSKRFIFKTCASLTKCTTQINNTQVDNAKDIDIVMPICNLLEYSEYYGKTTAGLYQDARDEPNANKVSSASCEFKNG